jgi:type I restriction enzyme R subunit
MQKCSHLNPSILFFYFFALAGEKFGYIYAPDIAPDSATPERSRYDDVLLTPRLEQALRRINPNIAPDILQSALKELQRIQSPDLLTNNETFHRLLTEGINISTQKDGNERGNLIKPIDFDTPNNNEFVVANQFTVIENHQNKRPDLILFINGIPLVVIELKNATDENATLQAAYQQLETYKQTIPSLFTPNAFLIISDGLEARAGSLSAGFSRFMAWKTADGKTQASPLVSQLETLIQGMLNKTTLLDLVRHFIVFEKSKKEDPQTGIISINTIKKLAAYHQYYAVNAAVASTLRAASQTQGGCNPPLPDAHNSSLSYPVPPSPPRRGALHAPSLHPSPSAKESPANYGLPGTDHQPQGDKKAGVVWHTQGSGKSLSMVFYTGKIVLALDNPTVLVITDRNDLDDQLFDTFAASKQLLRQEPVQAEDREQLKSLLKVGSGGVIFSTIQKFQPETGNIYEQLSDRRNIIVIADEAHRTQYGFTAKTIDTKDPSGQVIGKKVVYGFAKYLRDALPNATYLGFTGTPIEKNDVNTPAVFGNYVDI